MLSGVWDGLVHSAYLLSVAAYVSLELRRQVPMGKTNWRVIGIFGYCDYGSE